MEWSETLQNVLLLGGGAVAIKLLDYIADLVKGVLGRRKSELDRLGQELSLAVAERDKQTLLKRKALEMVYALRVMMIKSGHWTSSDLPDEPQE